MLLQQKKTLPLISCIRGADDRRGAQRIAGLDLDAQVIVVDDGSTDETAAIAQAAGATVIRQANPGKGAAIRAAIPLIEATSP